MNAGSHEFEFYRPFLWCLGYYVVVFVVGELSRRVVDKFVSRNTNKYTFLIEFIGTVQMCTCVYENGIMVKNYGDYALFFTVTSLLIAGGAFNRGAMVNPLPALEGWYSGTMTLGRALTLVTAQTLGGMSAFSCAHRVLWYYTADYCEDHHRAFLLDRSCNIHYRTDFPYVVGFEIIGTFLLRLVMHYLPTKGRKYVAPLAVSSFLTFALIFVGVPGLNPLIVSSRLFGCEGLPHQWFIFVYWLCPVLGWMCGAEFLKIMKSSKAAKKVDKKKKNK